MEAVTKATDFLAMLLYGLEVFTNPSPSRVFHFFVDGGSRDHWKPAYRAMKQSRFIERHAKGPAGRFHLTPKGRSAAMGGIDPVERWHRPWDRQWRVLLFDLPARRQRARLKLWRWLRPGISQRSMHVT